MVASEPVEREGASEGREKDGGGGSRGGWANERGEVEGQSQIEETSHVMIFFLEIVSHVCQDGLRFDG